MRSRLWRWLWRGTLIGLGAIVLLTLLLRWIPPPITGLQFYRCGESLLHGHAPQLRKSWVALEKISPHLQQAAVASEDQHFIEHWGFDFEAIEKAAAYNRKHPKRTHGASTISQQTAKNVFLWPARSWLRKGVEFGFTLLIEALWSKRRILEMYLNVAEFGDGLYGVEAASQKYFHKSAAKLSRDEAALLIACLPNPRKWSPAAPQPIVLRRQAAILNAMDELGPPAGFFSPAG